MLTCARPTRGVRDRAGGRCVSGATAKPVLFEPVIGELTGFEQARLSLVLMQASVADQSPAGRCPLSPTEALCIAS